MTAIEGLERQVRDSVLAEKLEKLSAYRATKQLYGSEWLEYDKRRVTMDGKTYVIRATTQRVIYPYATQVVRADAEEINCPASPDGRVYCMTDLLKSESDFPARLMVVVAKKRGAA